MSRYRSWNALSSYGLRWPILDDFEVSVFLTETSSRHAILKKDKRAKSEKPRLGTTKGRLTCAGTQDGPVLVEEGVDEPLIRQESQDGTDNTLRDIPAVGNSTSVEDDRSPAREGDDPLFVSEGSDDEAPQIQKQPNPRKVKEESVQLGPKDGEDDKKKMALNTTYDGFTIYGRILCLVVKRRGTARGKELVGGAGQAMMEEWIASTQAAEGQMMDD